MKDSSKTAERVLLLYILLSNGEYTREQIFEALPLYRETRTGKYAALNRDLSVIEKVGIAIHREKVSVVLEGERPKGKWQPGQAMGVQLRYSIK